MLFYAACDSGVEITSAEAIAQAEAGLKRRS
jgi:hypothetical protein